MVNEHAKIKIDTLIQTYQQKVTQLQQENLMQSAYIVELEAENAALKEQQQDKAETVPEA